jgi:hypothetical protein
MTTIVPVPAPANVTLFMYQQRAMQRQVARGALIKQLFSTTPNPYTSGRIDPNDSLAQQNKQNQILSDLAGSFSRFAGNQKTAFDNGTSNSSAGSDASQMQQRVERALTQVLGRSYGNSPAGFVNALTGAFPTAADGQQVVATPTRSGVSLYTSNRNGSTGTSTASMMGQLPARQAVLYRQANTVANDALPVLAGVMPFLPEADFEQVEALRAQVDAEIRAQIDEFGRIDEPRPERVRAYFDALTLHVNEFGRRALLDKTDLAVTSQDEAQTASFVLLRNYVDILRNIWDSFYDQDRSITFSSLSERVERANVLLPIIARGNDDFEAAMDSVDFTESDRRSTATKFTELLDDDVTLLIQALGVNNRTVTLIKPDITVFDLTDWLDRYANFEGPTSLTTSGQYGLDFVTDQADVLFWVIAPIVSHFQTTTPNLSGSSTLEQVFANERIEWSLNNLLTQLNALADLAVPAAKRNARVR